jgi:uncharacterized protein YjbI with pentapeptide repeats
MYTNMCITDYATKDLKEVDFSGKTEIGKDFTQCDAAGVKFKNVCVCFFVNG